jgi:hypothetical protein
MDSVEPGLDPALFSLNSRDILSIEVTALGQCHEIFYIKSFTLIISKHSLIITVR